MKIKLFGNVEVNVSWSLIIGFLLMYLSILCAMAYTILIEGTAGRFIQFLNMLKEEI